MSRGPGRVERAIIAAIEADPQHAVTVEDVCERLYPPVFYGPAKKHRVAVIRAGKTVAQRGVNVGYTSYLGRGNTGAFYAADELEAYAHANLKAMGWGHDDGSRQRHLENTFSKYMQPGGKWWLDIQLYIAEREGDAERVAEHRRAIERYQEQRHQALAMYAFEQG